MSSITEKCDSAQVEVRPSTLEIFDKFKPSLVDGSKSESEESFHLPMLDEDDESGKSVISNGKDKDSCHNGETEDEILNKFDLTNDTLENHLIDDSILDDDEDILRNDENDKKQDCRNDDIIKSSQNNEGISDKETVAQVEEFKEHTDATNNDESPKEISTTEQEFISQYESEDIMQNEDKSSGNCIENVTPEESNENEDKSPENCLENVTHEESNENKDKSPENCLENVSPEESNKKDEDTNNLKEPECMEQEVENANDRNEDILTCDASDAVQKNGVTEANEDNPVDSQEAECPEEEQFVESNESNCNSNVVDIAESSSIIPMEEDKDVEEYRCSEEETLGSAQIEDNKEDPVEDNEVNDTVETVCADEISSNEETKTASEIEDNDNDQLIDEDHVEDNISKDPLDSEDVNMIEIDESSNTVSNMDIDSAKHNEETNETDITKNTVGKESQQDATAKDAASEKGKLISELSNDSSKNNQEGDDDLLDISIIRDTAEDDACAIATAIADNTAKEQDDATAGSSDKSETNDEERSEHVTDDTSDRDNNDEPIDLDCDEDISCDTTTTGKSEGDQKCDGYRSDDKKDDNSETDNTNHNKTIKDNWKSGAINVVNVSDKEKLVKNTSDESKVMEEVSDNDVADVSEKTKTAKRSLSQSDINNTEVSAKKRKISEQEPQITKTPAAVKPTEDPKNAEKTVKTLTEFEKFMRTRKFMKRLTRSDLEQFCLQKICECIMLKSTDGELHQTIKKQDKVIDNLRKDILQLTKQAKDLEIVNRKLMTEFRSNLGNKKPMVPLRITRSVGLQVRLNSNNELNGAATSVRRRQSGTAHTPLKNVTPQSVTTPQKTTATTPTNAMANRRVMPVQNSAVRQIASSPVKTTATSTTPAVAQASNPLLSQALQKSNSSSGTIIRTPAAIPKRNTPIRPKPVGSATNADSATNKTPSSAGKQNTAAAASAPVNQSVIDLTDEDDRAKQPVKVMTKQFMLNSVNKNVINNNSNVKQITAGKTMVVSSTNAGNKVTTPTRTIATLPQGVRLTSSQVKNATGIAIPTITSSSSGTTQLMYVLPTISSSGGGTQKLAFVNIQPTNGVLCPDKDGNNDCEKVSSNVDGINNDALAGQELQMEVNSDGNESLLNPNLDQDSGNDNGCNKTNLPPDSFADFLISNNNENQDNEIIKKPRNLSKRLTCCCFCEKNVRNFKGHLFRYHNDQPEVFKLMSLRKGDQERRRLLYSLRYKGNNLMKKGNDFITTKLCPYCLGYFKISCWDKHAIQCRQIYKYVLRNSNTDENLTLNNCKTTNIKIIKNINWKVEQKDVLENHFKDHINFGKGASKYECRLLKMEYFNLFKDVSSENIKALVDCMSLNKFDEVDRLYIENLDDPNRMSIESYDYTDGNSDNSCFEEIDIIDHEVCSSVSHINTEFNEFNRNRSLQSGVIEKSVDIEENTQKRSAQFDNFHENDDSDENLVVSSGSGINQNLHDTEENTINNCSQFCDSENDHEENLAVVSLEDTMNHTEENTKHASLEFDHDNLLQIMSEEINGDRNHVDFSHLDETEETTAIIPTELNDQDHGDLSIEQNDIQPDLIEGNAVTRTSKCAIDNVPESITAEVHTTVSEEIYDIVTTNSHVSFTSSQVSVNEYMDDDQEIVEDFPSEITNACISREIIREESDDIGDNAEKISSNSNIDNSECNYDHDFTANINNEHGNRIDTAKSHISEDEELNRSAVSLQFTVNDNEELNNHHDSIASKGNDGFSNNLSSNHIIQNNLPDINEKIVTQISRKDNEYISSENEDQSLVRNTKVVVLKPAKPKQYIRWTLEQKLFVQNHFIGHLLTGKTPTKSECMNLYHQNSVLLNNKHWDKIRALISNTIAKKTKLLIDYPVDDVTCSWTHEQQIAIKEYLKEYIEKHELPSEAKCLLMCYAHRPLFRTTQYLDIREYIKKLNDIAPPSEDLYNSGSVVTNETVNETTVNTDIAAAVSPECYEDLNGYVKEVNNSESLEVNVIDNDHNTAKNSIEMDIINDLNYKKIAISNNDDTSNLIENINHIQHNTEHDDNDDLNTMDGDCVMISFHSNTNNSSVEENVSNKSSGNTNGDVIIDVDEYDGNENMDYPVFLQNRNRVRIKTLIQNIQETEYIPEASVTQETVNDVDVIANDNISAGCEIEVATIIEETIITEQDIAANIKTEAEDEVMVICEDDVNNLEEFDEDEPNTEAVQIEPNVSSDLICEGPGLLLSFSSSNNVNESVSNVKATIPETEQCAKFIKESKTSDKSYGKLLERSSWNQEQKICVHNYFKHYIIRNTIPRLAEFKLFWNKYSGLFWNKDLFAIQNLVRNTTAADLKVAKYCRRWTVEQKLLVERYFLRHIKAGKTPIMSECKFLYDQNSNLLKDKDWRKIRSLISNIINKRTNMILDDGPKDDVTNSVTWTDEQQIILKQYFQENIEKNTIPSVIECSNMLDKYRNLFDGKQYTDIREYIRHIISIQAGKCTRTVWTIEEKLLVQKHFMQNIKARRAPRKFECISLLDQNPILLKYKGWRQIQILVQNIISKKTKMLKDDGTSSRELPWTDEQQTIMKKYFKEHIQKKKVPSEAECMDMHDEHRDIFAHYLGIREYIRAVISKQVGCYSKVYWTMEQKKLVQNYFRKHIEICRVPTTSECEQFKNTYPLQFKNLTTSKIQAFICNVYTRNKKIKIIKDSRKIRTISSGRGKTKTKPSPWSKNQKLCVQTYFSQHIKAGRIPTEYECNTMRDAYPLLLRNKDWVKIKSLVDKFMDKESNLVQDTKQVHTNELSWLDEQKLVIQTHFGEHIQKQIDPGLGKCKQLIKQHPVLLKNISPLQIQELVRNIYRSKSLWTHQELKIVRKYFRNNIVNFKLPTQSEYVTFKNGYPDLFRHKTISAIRVLIYNLASRRTECFKDGKQIDGSLNTAGPVETSKITKPAPKLLNVRYAAHWNPEQWQVMHAYFQEHIRMEKPPTHVECKTLCNKFPDLFRNKSWAHISRFVRYYMKRKNANSGGGKDQPELEIPDLQETESDCFIAENPVIEN